MASFLYNGGLDALKTLGSDTFKVLLTKGTGYTPNKDDDHVADIVPASNECTVSGYARKTITGGTRTVDDSGDRITYGATDVSFGTLATGQNVNAVVYREVTNDSDHLLVAYLDLGSVDSDSADPFVLAWPSGLIAYVDMA